MIPLLLFLLGIAAVYVGTIETAFSALMKLSLRLMAERGRDDRLGFYLDDPVQLFDPARLRQRLHPRLRAPAADADRAPQPRSRARDPAAAVHPGDARAVADQRR